MLFGLTFFICSATSRMAALPEPLSLMPGPAPTESRWAPTITTLPSSPDPVSARTLYVVFVVRTVLAKICIWSPAVAASVAPSA